MSIQQQEKLLLDILFDRKLRRSFINDSGAFMNDYALTDEERADFSGTRLDALELDASMRLSMAVSGLSRHYPLAVSLFSSYKQGMELVRDCISPDLMILPMGERIFVFGERLGEKLKNLGIDNHDDKQLLVSLTGAELCIADSARQLIADRQKNHVDGKAAHQLDLSGNWQKQTLAINPYVSAVVLPRAFEYLRQALMPVPASQIWRYRQQTPLTESERSLLSSEAVPRLLVSRAYLSHDSAHDPVTEHVTVELAEGFIPLFQFINQGVSTHFLLQQMQMQGAQADLLNSIENGIKELLNNGMLSFRH